MTRNNNTKAPFKLLLVDDSWVLRRVLRGTLSQVENVEIVGEATNGVEALDLILKLSPDVILMDVEMPLMDGMTTLQHLMIHTPTPTIMISSLSKYGSPRCFDALKYGAIDFINKNSIFRGTNEVEHSRRVIRKVVNASRVVVPSIDLIQQNSESRGLKAAIETMIFCEDCGTRNTLKSWQLTDRTFQCKHCGDELALAGNKRYQRMNYITVIGAGAGGYANVLQIVPALSPDMGGALFAIIHDECKHVASFTRYLDSISDLQVMPGEDGMTVESGCCYIFSGRQSVALSSSSGRYRLQVTQAPTDAESGTIDEMMFSVSSLLKHRVSGVLLSGEESDGHKGLTAIIAQKGTGLVLNPDNCLHKQMTSEPFRRLELPAKLDTSAIASEIRKKHLGSKESVVTA